MKCPKCKQSNLTIVDHQPLFCAYSKAEAEQSKFFVDNVIYVEIKCWDCNEVFQKEGQITYLD